MTDHPIKDAAESAMLLVFARVAQVVLVPILLAAVSWTFISISNLQVDVARTIATSESNNRLLVQILGDLKERIIKLEDGKDRQK